MPSALPFIEYYKKWSLTGIRSGLNKHELKFVLLTNAITLTTLTLIVPYTLLFFVMGLKVLALGLIIVFFKFLLIMALTHRGYLVLSRVVMLLSLNIVLGAYSVLLGKDSGLHYLYFVFFTLPFLLFDIRSYYYVTVFSFLSAVFFMVIRNEVFEPIIAIEDWKLQILSNSLLVVTFAWLAINKLSLLRATSLVENDLQLKNDELLQEVAMRKHAEEQLTDTNELLQVRNKELEQFAYVASHDLQEPLRTINSFVELIERDYSSNFDEKGAQYMRYVRTASHRLKLLIKDLLDFNRIGQTDEAELKSAGEVLAAVIEDLSKSIEDADAEIMVAEMPAITVHEAEFRLLMQNLLTNAIKFRKAEVRCQVEISAEDAGRHWKFRVKDNGIGIEEKYLERIFIIFQRLHNHDDYEGNGIGLAHCKKIVELNGGKIWVESELGKGSSFCFTLLKT